MNKVKSNLTEFFDNFKRVLKRPEMSILPGQIAYFFFLAIVPTLTLISYGASLLNLSTDIIFDFVAKAFSSDVASLLLTSQNDISGLRIIIFTLIGYFVASNGPASIIVTSNTIYGEEQNSFFYRRIKAIIMTFILVVLFIFMLIVPVFGNKIIGLFKYVNMSAEVTKNVATVINFLQGPLTWLTMYFFIKILYVIAPNRSIKSKTVGYGALFTTVSWIVITYIYSYYINNIAHYSTLYGNLANIIVLMVWFYFLAYAFTIGMALNYRKEEVQLEKTASLKVDKK
jgi:membrane protein